MAKYDRYHPNYKKLYPGIGDRPEILTALKKSDRKMEYIEVDLKSERFVQDQETGTAVFLPSREDSYERLRDEDKLQFAADEDTLEEKVIRADELQRLRAALRKLAPDEAELIHALFFEGLSVRQFTQRTGIPAMTVHDRKKKILVKLYKLLKN